MSFLGEYGVNVAKLDGTDWITEALETQRQRLETADTLLDLASGEMEDALESLQGGKGRAGGADFAAAAAHTGRAV